MSRHSQRATAPTAVPPVATCLGVARNATKAAVFVIERSGGAVVRKQLFPMGARLLVRIGRALLRREARMLGALAGTGLVPRLLASGADWIETALVAGETVSSRRHLGLTEDEARRLREALRSFHASGFAHGDLGRRDMILTPDGGVVILDVATAIGPGHPPFLGRLLLPLARRHDVTRLEEIIRKARARRDAWDEERALLGA